jgi:hypothetical protein
MGTVRDIKAGKSDKGMAVEGSTEQANIRYGRARQVNAGQM